jgi:hypothetical protein
MALREGLNQLMGVETMSYPHLPATPQPAFSSVMNGVHVAAGTRRPPLPETRSNQRATNPVEV